MSRRNAGQRQAHVVELKLNLSPATGRRASQPQAESPPTSTATSPTSSCISSESNYSTGTEEMGGGSMALTLVGCPRCLMYVMLAEDDPRCPKCKSSVLIDIIHSKNSKNT